MEERVAQMLEIAHGIVEDGRRPTAEERERFRELEQDLQGQPVEWRERFADLIDRLASALEGMGI